MKLTDKVDSQAGQIAALTATIEALKSRPRWGRRLLGASLVRRSYAGPE